MRIKDLLFVSLFAVIVGCGDEEDDTGTADDTGASTPSAECVSYCADQASTCTDANEQFASEDECLTTCAGFPTTGSEGDTSGDTVQCRIYHLGAAANDADLHCAHTGTDGGGVCVD